MGEGRAGAAQPGVSGQRSLQELLLRTDPHQDPYSIRKLLEALQLRLHYAGQAIQEGDPEKAASIVASVREGCDLAIARLHALCSVQVAQS
jgi:hypothetical protein